MTFGAINRPDNHKRITHGNVYIISLQDGRQCRVTGGDTGSVSISLVVNWLNIYTWGGWSCH